MNEYQIINYVDCTEAQLKEIFNLRNLPEIRRWMTNTNEINWESHIHFIEFLRSVNDRAYYAIYNNGILVGTYNLTKEYDKTWERGIIISPEFQGTGATLKLEQWILDNLPKDKFNVILAKVKLDNQRSLRYHEKMGFIETHKDDEYVYYKLIL